MSSAKRVLGRGLADLIPVGGNAGGAEGADSPALVGSQEVPIASLHPNPRQPRTRFDEGALNELAESVRANGILQPILVRPRAQSGFEIVAGERRYRAALKAGLKQIPVVVRSLTDEETLALALIENLIREDIGPLETARAFQRLMDDFGWNQEEMGRRVGKSRPAVSNSLRLLQLPEPIQRSLENGELSEGHARALLGDERQRHQADFKERQTRVWRNIVTKGLSVRDTERLMRSPETAPDTTLAGARADTPGSNARSTAAAQAVTTIELRALEDRLRDALGTQVKLVGGEDRGHIEIAYFSGEELDGLLNRLEGTPEPLPTPVPVPPAPGRTRAGSGPIQGLLANRKPR